MTYFCNRIWNENVNLNLNVNFNFNLNFNFNENDNENDNENEIISDNFNPSNLVRRRLACETLNP